MKHRAFIRTLTVSFFGILFSIGFFFQLPTATYAADSKFCCTCAGGVVGDKGSVDCIEVSTKDVTAASQADATNKACADACTMIIGESTSKCVKSVAAGACPAAPAAGTVTVNASVGAKIPALGNPLGTTSIPDIIGRVINTFLGISGSLALLMFVYGGFTWIVSGGAPDKIKQGKDTLLWAAIGIVFIFSSYALISFLIKAFNAAGQ